MPDYTKGKIYCIRTHSQPELVYVGSTTQPLSVRFSHHKCEYKKLVRDNNEKYYSVFKVLKYGDCYIELVENYPCDNKEQLLRREGEIIKQVDCINKHLAGRTKAEYYRDNIEKIREQHKKYREKNKEQIREKMKKYREQNKEKLKEYNKKYHEENKEHFQEYNKNYYEENKQKILKKAKEKITCKCGSTTGRYDIQKHYRTKKHQEWLSEQN